MAERAVASLIGAEGLAVAVVLESAEVVVWIATLGLELGSWLVVLEVWVLVEELEQAEVEQVVGLAEVVVALEQTEGLELAGVVVGLAEV